jgi:hypothetical protein
VGEVLLKPLRKPVRNIYPANSEVKREEENIFHPGLGGCTLDYTSMVQIVGYFEEIYWESGYTDSTKAFAECHERRDHDVIARSHPYACLFPGHSDLLVEAG